MLLVTYDLRKPGRDYQSLYDFLKGSTAWARVAESVWLIKTTDSATSVRDKVKAHVDANDLVFVVKLAWEWAASNVSSDVLTWLKNDSHWK